MVEIFLVCWFVWWISLLVLHVVLHHQVEYYGHGADHHLLCLHGHDLVYFLFVDGIHRLLCMLVVRKKDLRCHQGGLNLDVICGWVCSLSADVVGLTF